MLTIDKIKDTCIEIDIQNVYAGDKSIGTFLGNRFLQFRDLHDVELFYSNISLKDLLKIYSQYHGLEDYKTDEPDDYRHSYSLDILSIIKSI